MSRSIYRILLWVFIAISIGSYVHSQEVLDRSIWDLSPLCANDTLWERDRDAIIDKISSIQRLKGTVADSPGNLADALDAAYDLRSRTGKLVIYGFLTTDSDNRSERARMQYDVGNSLEFQVESAVEFIEDEIRNANSARIREWMHSEPRLLRHRRRINRILRESPNALPGPAQAVVESMARWPRMAAEVRSSLFDVDLGWPIIVTSSGDSITADFAGHSRVRRLPNARDRAAVNHAFYRRIKDFENPFGLLLTGRIEADLTIARHRNFESGIDAIWYLRDGMPLGSAQTLVNVTRRNLSTLQRYIKMRGQALALDIMTDADISAPTSFEMPAFEFGDAMRIAGESTGPLGSGFQNTLRYCLAQPWMSPAPAPEKNATYAVWPPIGDAPPYLIMSFQPNYVASRAFVGGATLMTAFASAMPDNTSDTRDDPGIYSNAMIYVGDISFDDYMIAGATSRDERIAYYLAAADLLYRQYFRWALVCDFDRRLENLIANGDIPNGARISKMFLDLSREYYGSDQGLITIDSLYGAEWMTYAVPFLSYEHEFWPPAMAAACVVLDRIEAGDDKVRDSFYRVLGRGDLDLTYTLFKDMGIELASEEPYLAVMQRMNHLLDGLETELRQGN